MTERSGAQISKKAFLQSALILLSFMLLSGILTRVVPVGSFARFEEAGRILIDPESYQAAAQPDYPIWRWLTAPIEVLWGDDLEMQSTVLWSQTVGG